MKQKAETNSVLSIEMVSVQKYQDVVFGVVTAVNPTYPVKEDGTVPTRVAVSYAANEVNANLKSEGRLS